MYLNPVVNGRKFDGYFISHEGLVYSEKSGKFLKLINDGGGYLQASLAVPKKINQKCRISKRIHLILWETFVGEVPKGFELNHKDGDKTNNSLDNLELCTSTDNNRHAVSNLNRTTRKTFSYGEVKEIRKHKQDGMTYKELVSKYGGSYRALHKLVNNVTYKEYH